MARDLYVEVTEWNFSESFQKGMTQLAFSLCVSLLAFTLLPSWSEGARPGGAAAIYDHESESFS